MKHTLFGCFLFLLCSTSWGYADGAAMQGVGGALQPMKEHPSVVMEKMLIDVDVNPEQAKVRCQFTFRNTGPATQVLIGFPESGNIGAEGKDKQPQGFTEFSAKLDGHTVKTKIEGYHEDEDDNWERWRTW